MYDYRKVQIQELEKKIEETRALLSDPALKEMAEKEIAYFIAVDTHSKLYSS